MQRYRRVTYEVRCQIYAYLKTKNSISEIAKLTGYHRSTVYREIKRHGGISYSAASAQEQAKKSFRKCRRTKKLNNYDLRLVVFKKLHDGWSPEQISGRMKLELRPAVSKQVIYNALENDCRDWQPFLRKKGKPQGGRRRLRGKLKRPNWMNSIHIRPEYINNRSEFGHWERDGMFGKDKNQIIVFTERKSRFLKAFKAKQPYSAHLNEQMVEFIANMKEPVLSITNDNGNEFLDGFRFKFPIYYCDPRSPYQKGTVENSIGLLRQYIPKKTNIELITDEYLRAIEDKMNHRPRKCLGYKTPYEVLYKANVALAS